MNNIDVITAYTFVIPIVQGRMMRISICYYSTGVMRFIRFALAFSIYLWSV